MDRRVIEGIEVCRPASDDLKRRDLADVARAVEFDGDAQIQYQRVQAWDAAISGAMEQVDVPPSLAERILSRVQAAQSAAASTCPVLVSPSAAMPTAGSPGPSRFKSIRSRRREWLGAAAGVAALVLVSLLLHDWFSPRSEASLDELADGWLADLARETGPWQAMSTARRDFPMPDVVTASASGWRPVKSARGVAYQLRTNVGKATLFVMKMATTDLPSAPPSAPPFVPQSTTGGRSVGYWQTGRLVYVLVVDGDQRSYRSIVSTSGAPFA